MKNPLMSAPSYRYDLLRVTPEVDAVVRRLSAEVVGPFWPPERALVERGYGAIEFPFEEVPAPAFAMGKLWTLPDLLGYLRTWSATRRFEEATGEDPLRIVERRPVGSRPSHRAQARCLESLDRPISDRLSAIS